MHSFQKLKVIVVNERLEKLLEIAVGDPIFYKKRNVYDAGMRIIEYNKCYYRNDKITIKRST